ncbi:MAG: hypothetical protein IKN87_00530 [Bacilli bacterium]|nr:hypothetical protein [Bacilli bacterium]
MDNKVYFEVENNMGILEKMELLAQFNLEQFDKNYIIYKNLDNNNLHFYAAAYEMTDDGSSNLNTDLSTEEKNAINAIFLSIKG